MGRSVNYLNRAEKVSYIRLDSEDEFAFDDIFVNVKYGLKGLFPSLTECRRWDGNETLIFLENSLVEIAISEYCGLVSVSVRPNEYREINEALAVNWIYKVWDKAENKFAEFSYTLKKVGTFSNGESVFVKA